MLSVFFMACGSSRQKAEDAGTAAEETAEITLTKAPRSPEHATASLIRTETSVEANDSLNTVNFTFEVANYELGIQTEDAESRGIANSGKGQHIHFIVNNGPYSAHYESSVSKQMEDGNYVVLAFLSRSYHESVKNPSAFYVDNLKVGDVESEETDLTAQHLFYSRPKGTYKGADTKKLMLDFYLVNTAISPDGNKVKATINGTEFIIDEWAPYYIEGLPEGEVTIALELLDAEENLIDGPFNQVERKVMLEE